MDRRAFFRAIRPEASTLTHAAAFTLQPVPTSAGLEPFAGALDTAQAKHLLRRTGFGARSQEVNALVGQSVQEAVAHMVASARARPLPSEPAWANAAIPGKGSTKDARKAYSAESRSWLKAYRRDWVGHLLEGGLREMMVLFWHNHFVTEAKRYKHAVWAYRYFTILRQHALGNFQTLVHDIGLTPAMLIYLDGQKNRKGKPNENYARELLELFTMGQFDGSGARNYTQQDITEIARALTGWQVDLEALDSRLNPKRFDAGDKSFFEQTGAFGYDEVIRVLFEQRAPAIADFVARKLYQFFVYAVPDEQVVARLAQNLLNENFEIAPVVQTLLSSAHFFDSQARNAQIKSPIGLLLGLAKEIDGAIPQDQRNRIVSLASGLGQQLFNPPNVAGWKGHRAWINTNTLPRRWNARRALVNRPDRFEADLFTLAKGLHDPSDPHFVFYVPTALAEHFLPVALLEVDIPEIEDDFGGDLDKHPIPDEILALPPHMIHLAKVFLDGLRWYRWDPTKKWHRARVNRFVRFLTELPEFQLT